LDRDANGRGRDDAADVHPAAAFDDGQQHAYPVRPPMQLAQVVGHATSTVKHATLNGWRLLVVQAFTLDGKPAGEPVLAIDTLGAALGARVIVTTDAVQVRELVGARNSPLRYSVMGLSDE